MEAIINDIQSRIAAEVPAIKYVDEDWGQLDYYTPNFPVKWPCVLIDILSIQWQDLGNKKQQGVAQLRLKIADLRLSNSSAKAPLAQRNNSKSFYTLTQLIYQKLQGWSNNKDLYTTLARTAERRMQRDDGVKLHEMIFATQITDVSAAKVYTPVARPVVKFDTKARF